MLWLIFVCLIFKSKSELAPLEKGLADLRYAISSCVVAIAKVEFPMENIITVSLSTKDYKNYTNSAVVTDQILLKSLHKQTRWTILIKKSNRPEHHSTFWKKSDEYIIQLRDADEFEYLLESLMKMNSWNPHAKFIVITTTIFQNTKKIIEFIFQKLWTKKVLNAVVMLPRNATDSILDIFSWYPYFRGNCGNSFSRAFIINKCNKGYLETGNLLFPEKIPRDMNNCPVYARAVIWPPYVILSENKLIDGKYVNLKKGIEILILNTVAKVANFNVLYTVSNLNQDWGVLHKNGTATGMMKSVLDGEADIGVGAIASLGLRHYYFDPSVSYIWESVTWCVPHAMPIPKWKCLIRIFTPLLWLSILVAYFIVTIFTWWISNLEINESTSYTRKQSVFQNTLSMLLGLTVKTLPRMTKIRLLVIFWVIASLHLNAAFTSSLIRELTEPSYEEQISNINELKTLGFEFGVVPPTSRFFRYEGKYYYTEISSWTSCTDVKMCLDRTAQKRNFAVGIPRMYMQYASHKYVTKNGRMLLYWLKSDIASYPVEMIMTKGFPLLKRINNIISRIKEAGLIAKWQYDFLEKADDNLTLPISYDDTQEIILTQIHLEGAFILLIIGLIFAAVVFICEIFETKRKDVLNFEG